MKLNDDFKKYYCKKIKKHVWVLGYFGGGSINFKMFKSITHKFCKETGLPEDTVQIDEIFKSRRFKGFKFLYSDAEAQTPLKDSIIESNVFKLLEW